MNKTEGSVALAEWAATVERSRTLSAAPLVIAAVRDVLGCMLAGQAEAPPQAAARAVRGWGSGPARVVGTSDSLPAPFAALVNGAAAHVLDYDDSFYPLTGHACATIVPAILATAEQIGASGADVIDAIVVALEVAARVGLAGNPRHYAVGWHATSTMGVIACAAGCARILGLSATQTRHALSFAVSQAAGTRMQLGTTAKCMHAGLAAKGGVIAAALAAEGLTGADESLLGQWRFIDMYAGVEARIVAPAEDEDLAIVTPGITYKPYPTCAATHRSIAAVLDLRAQHGFTADDVEKIEAVIPTMNVANLIYPDPRTGMEGRFSLQYTTAVAAAQGRVTPADFEPAALQRPEVRRLLPRITMTDLPGSEDCAQDYLYYPAHTTIYLRNGAVLKDTRYHRNGSPEHPMTLAQQVGKFRDCALVTLPAAQVDAAIETINRLDSLAKISELTAALATG